MKEDIQKPKKVLLIIRDGWGYSPETEFNMIAQANTPYTDYLEKNYPTTFLHASGEEVGLPEGYFGNSEVGHMTIGAGRVLEQSLLRINNAIKKGEFFENKEFLKAINLVKEKNTKLHLIGLLQKEGVHASFDHLIALLELSKREGLEKDDVYIHVITDGRDSEKQHAINYLIDLESEIERIGVGRIVSLSGRYFAMDRNKNWERTEKYYKALLGQGEQKFSELQIYFREKYLDPEFSDEFLEPVTREDFSGIKNNDAIIFYNFRKDRARQLTKVFAEKDFSEFITNHQNIHFVSMTEYYEGLNKVVFPDSVVENILGKILEDNNKTQLRISETEKYAHVTFFFDGGEDHDFVGEKKILIPSPDVATYDLKPEMASSEITERLIFEIENNVQDFILCNFPNADMVGHSGNHEAIKLGLEAVDKSMEKIVPIALENGYTVLLTADHGNAEYKNAKYETSHTKNPVPFTMVSELKDHKSLILKGEMGLKNILATTCKIMGIKTENIHEKPLF